MWVLFEFVFYDQITNEALDFLNLLLIIGNACLLTIFH